MYCAEQIVIPTDLGAVMKHYTKAIILEQPSNILKWSANYFARLANLPTVFGPNGEYLDAVGRGTQQPFQQPPSQQWHPKQEVEEGEEGEVGSPVTSEGVASTGGGLAIFDAEQINAIFTPYNAESGRVSAEDIQNLFRDLKSQLGFEVSQEEMDQYLNQVLPKDEDGKYNLQDVYTVLFQQQ